jgi:peptidyl-dipeptidase A
MLTRPADREVECHASAWEVESGEDVRIKMCIRVNEEDLRTLHHELGHIYYYRTYKGLPALFRDAAHDGFHEAIGDALLLSVTPEYLRRVGLGAGGKRDQRALINWQLKSALDLVAFLPWGRTVDQWRWDVFAGKVKPADYQKAWWDLRVKFQGVARPLPDAAGDFDPGAKYHVAANVPYLPYFFAQILQFQLHRGMCRAAGHQGPLHECSIFGNAAAGDKLRALLAMGASKPWPDALAAITGERQMDPGALLEYYAPLHEWLRQQNRGKQCGW